MLTEIIVSSLLTASITGAGLIIAIYALITPLARRIFEYRLQLHHKKKKQFDKMREEINEESSDKDFKRLKTLAAEIKEIRIFPKYLGIGVLYVFSSYIFTAFFAMLWLQNPRQDWMIELMIVGGFLLSTLGFWFVGVFAIADVIKAMKGEFQQIKKQKEEVEKTSRDLEAKRKLLKNRIEALKRRRNRANHQQD